MASKKEWLKEVAWELLLQNEEMRDLLHEANDKLSSESHLSKRVATLEAKLKTMTVDAKTRETVSKSDLRCGSRN